METLAEPPEVLQQFAKGDCDAFETLFRQYQKEVYRWIIRIVRDPASAEDLTVETFWRTYRARARFDPQRSFGAWARTIATNVALDYLKRSRVRHELQADSRMQTLERLPARPNADRIEQRNLRVRTALAFGQLPAKLRVVAVLALVEEAPHAEIAEALNISPAAVKSRVFRAVQRLRRKLKDLDVNYD
jgi:RNA polymerase sigma factor CnrH